MLLIAQESPTVLIKTMAETVSKNWESNNLMLSLTQLLIKFYYKILPTNSGTIHNRTGCSDRTMGISWIPLRQTGTWSPLLNPKPEIFNNSISSLFFLTSSPLKKKKKRLTVTNFSQLLHVKSKSAWLFFCVLP